MSTTPALPSLSELVHRKERLYYAIMLAVSIAVYAGIALAIWNNPALIASVLMYVIIGSLAVLLARGMLMGRIRGNAIRISPKQLPSVHRQITEHARSLEMEEVPEVYLMQAGGVMNAFAIRFLGRAFVVIYSDVLEMAMEKGEAAVGFIVAHELAHHKRGHLKRRWLTWPGHLIPYLGSAYSRACEYTCDRFGARCQPDGAVAGLLALAAGKQAYRAVDPVEFASQAETENDFWIRRAEVFSTHPRLPKRVAEVLKIGAKVPAYSPMQGVSAAHVS